jgi:hypothetical protein
MRFISGIIVAVVAALSMSTAAPATMPPTAWIDRIEMRLFYIYSGTLSENIAAPAEFFGWNTVIGEGSAKEPADDVLVTVYLKRVPGSGGGFDKVSIIAKDARGKILGKRIAEPYMADEQGNAAVALLLHDATCAGTITVTAKMGRALAKSNTANLSCGE